MAAKTYTPPKTQESGDGGKVVLAGAIILALLFLLLRKRGGIQANLRLDSLIISPKEVYPADKVTIQVNATNIGTNAGQAIVSFYDGANLLERRTIELGPSGNTLVSIEIYPVTLGVHDITVDPGGLTDSFEVITPQAPPQTPVTIGLYGTGRKMYGRYNFVSNTVPRRYFEFYPQGGNLYFASSRDAWWDPTITRGLVVASLGNAQWSLFYNPVSNHIHLVYGGKYYQRGTPDQFGEIVWDPVQTTGFTFSDRVSCSCDSSDHPFVSTHVWVYKSATADGTWVEDTAMGFPKQIANLQGQVNVFTCSKIMQLLGDKMALVYTQTKSHYSACYCVMMIYTYDGVGNWNIGGRTPLNVGSLGYHESFSAVSNGDSVHLVFLDSYVGLYYQGECARVTNPYPGIHYAEYQYASNSIVRTALLSAATPAPFSVICKDDYGDLYVFWVIGSDIMLAFTRGGLWQPTIYVVESDPDAGTGGLKYPHIPDLEYKFDIHIYYTASGLLKFFPLPSLMGV